MYHDIIARGRLHSTRCDSKEWGMSLIGLHDGAGLSSPCARLKAAPLPSPTMKRRMRAATGSGSSIAWSFHVPMFLRASVGRVEAGTLLKVVMPGISDPPRAGRTMRAPCR